MTAFDGARAWLLSLIIPMLMSNVQSFAIGVRIKCLPSAKFPHATFLLALINAWY